MPLMMTIEIFDNDFSLLPFASTMLNLHEMKVVVMI